MGEINFDEKRDAPPPPEKKAGSLGQQGHDRVTTTDKGDVKGHPLDATQKHPIDAGSDKKKDGGDSQPQVPDAKDKILSESERAERASMSKLTDRIPFSHGGKSTTLDAVQQVLNNMPADQRGLLNNPKTTLYIIATASRSGSADINQDISQARGDNVKDLIEANRDRLQIKANIEVLALGESEAQKAERPDGHDDRDDRTVKFDVLPSNQGDVIKEPELTDQQARETAEEWTKNVPDGRKTNNEKEFIDNLKEAASTTKDVGEHVLTDNFPGMAKDAAKLTKVLIEKWAENTDHAHKQGETENLVRGFTDAFRNFVKDENYKGIDFVGRSSPEERQRAKDAYNNGVLLLSNELAKKTPEEIRQIKDYAKEENNRLKIYKEMYQLLQLKLNH